MSKRFEAEFERVRMPLPGPVDPADPTGALRRHARVLRAEAQRAALVWLGRRLRRALTGLLGGPLRRHAPERCPGPGCG
jgi:hypothetical protein